MAVDSGYTVMRSLRPHSLCGSENEQKRVGTTGTIMRSRFATLILVCFSVAELAACECLDNKCEVSSPHSVCMVNCSISRGFSVVVQINGHYTFTTCKEGIIESAGQCVIRNVDEDVVGVKFNQSFTGNITMVTLDPNNAYCSRICNLPISQDCGLQDSEADCIFNQSNHSAIMTGGNSEPQTGYGSAESISSANSATVGRNDTFQARGPSINCSVNDDATVGGKSSMFCTYSLGSKDCCGQRLPFIKVQDSNNATVVNDSYNAYCNNSMVKKLPCCNCTRVSGNTCETCQFNLTCAGKINESYYMTNIKVTVTVNKESPRGDEVYRDITLPVYIFNQSNSDSTTTPVSTSSGTTPVHTSGTTSVAGPIASVIGAIILYYAPPVAIACCILCQKCWQRHRKSD